MYLVDTNVLSAGGPGRREDAAALADWLDARSDELFLSTIIVAEVGNGIAKLRRSGSLAPTASTTGLMSFFISTVTG